MELAVFDGFEAEAESSRDADPCVNVFVKVCVSVRETNPGRCRDLLGDSEGESRAVLVFDRIDENDPPEAELLGERDFVAELPPPPPWAPRRCTVIVPNNDVVALIDRLSGEKVKVVESLTVSLCDSVNDVSDDTVNVMEMSFDIEPSEMEGD